LTLTSPPKMHGYIAAVGFEDFVLEECMHCVFSCWEG
jgi:hypothetical protein